MGRDQCDIEQYLIGVMACATSKELVLCIRGLMDLHYLAQSHTLRLLQGYAKTRGFWVTGHAGTGAVLYLAYPDQTAYPHHGIWGIDGYLPRSLLSHPAFYSGKKITSRYMKKGLKIEG